MIELRDFILTLSIILTFVSAWFFSSGNIRSIEEMVKISGTYWGHNLDLRIAFIKCHLDTLFGFLFLLATVIMQIIAQFKLKPYYLPVHKLLLSIIFIILIAFSFKILNEKVLLSHLNGLCTVNMLKSQYNKGNLYDSIKEYLGVERGSQEGNIIKYAIEECNIKKKSPNILANYLKNYLF